MLAVVARHVYEKVGGGSAGAMAARQYMDTQLRAKAPWPSTSLYTQLAEDFGQLGQTWTSEFLRSLADAGKSLEEARSAWEARYEARGPMAVDQLVAALRRDDDLVSWDPGGPYLGIDGARYEPGSICLEHTDEPVVIIEGRGGREVITGWAGFGEMQNWIAGRGTGGSRGLVAPPVGTLSRTWLEDTVLAYIINHPLDTRDALRSLEPDAMTTDVRYEVLDAVRRLAGRGSGSYSPETVRAEARSRLSYVPAEGLARYGGPGGPFIRAYVSRLAETPVLSSDFRSAVQTLREEDLQARQRGASVVPQQPGQRDGRERSRLPSPAAVTPGTCTEFPPRHVPGPRTGPVQGR